MIKKLVKYGNSQAIILDKSILELLNIQEGSLLKLRTDGTSLIITPQSETGVTSQPQKITPSIEPEKLIVELAAQKSLKNPKEFDSFQKEVEKIAAQGGDRTLEQLEEVLAKTKMIDDRTFTKESLKKMQEVFVIHQETMTKMVNLGENPDFIHERVSLCEKHQNNSNSQELLDELVELQCKYVPEYRKMAADLRQAGGVI